MTKTAEPQLTPEQAEIVHAGPESRLLVIAGAGCGKTHVLVARLQHLIAKHELSPGREILILSFSRAAVNEVRRRLKGVGGDVAYARAFTFDSFATRLLLERAPDGAWAQSSYDDRIRAATELLRSDADAKNYLAQYRHVMVDEIQDLVGVRADFVKVILDLVSGFTLFGDPAQAIYNYQLQGRDRRPGSTTLFGWIRASYGTILVERRLSTNFRALSHETREPFRIAAERLADPSPDYVGIRRDLEDFLLSLASIGNAKAAVPLLLQLSRATGTTAILCRTNGEALLTSQTLRTAGVQHRLQREATDRAVAPWVAIVLGALPHLTIGRKRFLEAFQAATFSRWGGPSAEHAWALLKRIDRRRTDDLDLRRVADGIRLGAVPDELTQTTHDKIVVSTIHRAKGLEFDRVVVVEPPAGYEETGDEADTNSDSQFQEETRVLYVALTRPRSELYLMKRPNTRFVSRLERRFDERWILRNDWKVFGFEARGEDAHRDDPVGSFVVDGPAMELQRYLNDMVSPGDGLTLLIAPRSEPNEDEPHYSIDHSGTCVGVTSARFGGILRGAQLRYWSKARAPERIGNVFVDTIDTVAGTAAAAQRAGLGSSGLWLRIRPYGLGAMTF